jgi:DNA helicase-2/ATP-dependent DNA helicase PcrA
VTFTNKAAREMRERVAHILGREVEGLWLGTFHSLCARMLRRHAEYVGLTSGFTILDTDDQTRLLKQVMEAEAVDMKRWPAQGLMAVIQRWKDRGLTPARVTPAEDSDYANGRARTLYEGYQRRLASLNAADFGDLLLHVTEILRTRPDVLAQYHRAFRYILVDEYQDTNLVQYLWLRLLAQREDPGSRNICCVGDDDQSIYSWRGAEIENILRFEKDFPGARIVRLESNYRSTRPILAAASGLIAHNTGRLGKTLRSGRNDAEGEKVRVVSLWDSVEEARMVGERIEAARRSGHKLSEIAILVRAGFQTRAFEERLIVLGLPYRVVGGLKFYERQEIRDALAYMRVLAQPSDDLAFERIVNLPKRGLGDTALRAMHVMAREQRIPLSAAAARLVEGNDLRSKPRQALAELLRGFARWREALGREGHVLVAATLLDESGYTDMWKADKSPEAPGRLENLKEFIRALGEFETLGGFLEHVALVMENDENAEGDRLSLMTLHAAKGLEFDMVFLPGWEEGLFPHQRALDESGEKGLEEERRLAYVGPDAGAQARGRQQRREPADLRHLVELRPLPLPRRVAGGGGAAGGRAAQARARMLDGPSVFSGAHGLQARRPRVIEAGSWEVQERPKPAQAMARASASSTRSSATAPCWPRRTTASTSSSTRQAPSACSAASWSGRRRPERHGQAQGPPARNAVDRGPRRGGGAPLRGGAPAGLRDRRPLPGRGDGHLADRRRARAGRGRCAAGGGAGTCRPVAGIEPPALQAAPVEAEGWLARTLHGFPEQPIGRRFLVRPTHLPDPSVPGRIVLRLDAGLAFGSGEHGSTRGCLLALEGALRDGRPMRRILDIGTGSGILALGAALATRRPVLATDIEPWSVRVTAENARMNGAARLVRAQLANGWAAPGGAGGAALRPRLRQHPGPAALRHGAGPGGCAGAGGTAILSGLLLSQVRMVLAAHRRQGLVLERQVAQGNWAALVLRRRG